MALVHVRHDQIHRAADFAIAGVFGQEQALAFAGDLQEQREPRLELVLPIDAEAQPVDIERQAAPGAEDAQLRDDGLAHADAPGR
ncbi:hypothetical protein D3C71_2037220 [compost metagenome]